MWQCKELFYGSNANVLRRLRARRMAQRMRLAGRTQQQTRDYAQLDTFHRAMQPFMCFAQLFGIMPLVNMLHADPNAVHFRLCSLGMCMTVIFMFFGILKVLSDITEFIEIDSTSNFVNVAFDVNSLLSCVTFISLAHRWPQLIRRWLHVDMLLLRTPYKMCDTTLQRKVRLFACSFGIVALAEHCFYFTSKYYEFRMYKLHCHPNVTSVSFRDYIVESKFKQVFEHVSFNIFLAICCFVLHGSYTFIWNYLDLFLMLVSFGLTMRFRQFAQRVLALVGKYVPDALWHDIRSDHLKLCELMEHVNANLSTIIFISVLNNMYFICMQLLNIFTQLRYPINYFYFWFSLVFQVGRTTSIFMCASKIHDASLLPLKALYMVPSNYWTEEVQRFMHQLSTEYIALSGHHFFYVTRKSFFGMVGSIVTYELMLLQFDIKYRETALPDLCQ